MQVVLVYLQYISAKIHSKCASQPKIAKKHLKPLFWGFKVVQGHRCWYRWKARRQCLLFMISSMSVPMCNRFHARRANSGKMTTFYGRGYPCLMPSFKGNPLTQRHENLSQKKPRVLAVAHSEDFMILGCVVLT